MTVCTLLVLLVPVCVSRINGYSVIVTRGFKDSIETSIHQKSDRSLRCYNNTCRCKKNFPSYIFDSTSLTGKCVKDSDIFKDKTSRCSLQIDSIFNYLEWQVENVTAKISYPQF